MQPRTLGTGWRITLRFDSCGRLGQAWRSTLHWTQTGLRLEEQRCCDATINNSSSSGSQNEKSGSPQDDPPTHLGTPLGATGMTRNGRPMGIDSAEILPLLSHVAHSACRHSLVHSGSDSLYDQKTESRSQREHKPSTKALSAWEWPKHARQRHRIHPETLGQKGIFKKRLSVCFCSFREICFFAEVPRRALRTYLWREREIIVKRQNPSFQVPV